MKRLNAFQKLDRHPHHCFSVDFIWDMREPVSYTHLYEAENGILHWKETVSSLPYGFQGESYGSALLISRNGTRLYAANRGADTIALFAIEADRKLRPLAQYPCGGHWPRHMEFSKDETMLFVANERSGSVTLHCVDSETGELRIVGQIPFQRPGFAAEWDEF